MYELKQGRASMFMGGVGGLVMVGFAVLWTGLSLSLGAPIWFSLFGMLLGVFAELLPLGGQLQQDALGVAVLGGGGLSAAFDRAGKAFRGGPHGRSPSLM